MKVARGDVWLADLGEPIGHEQGYRRPVVVVSPDRFHRTPSSITVVAPITGRDRGLISHVRLEHVAAGLDRPSWIRLEDVRSISQSRLRKRLGEVSSRELFEIRGKLAMLLDL